MYCKSRNSQLCIKVEYFAIVLCGSKLESCSFCWRSIIKDSFACSLIYLLFSEKKFRRDNWTCFYGFFFHLVVSTRWNNYGVWAAEFINFLSDIISCMNSHNFEILTKWLVFWMRYNAFNNLTRTPITRMIWTTNNMNTWSQMRNKIADWTVDHWFSDPSKRMTIYLVNACG